MIMAADYLMVFILYCTSIYGIFTLLREAMDMKKCSIFCVGLFVLVVELFMTGCGQSGEQSMTGVWSYSDTTNGMNAVYNLKDDGTGTYTMTVGDQEVTYELKYEVNDGHLLVRYVNNDIFSEEDVFDNEFSFKDANTLIIKDSFDEEMTFVKQ